MTKFQNLIPLALIAIFAGSGCTTTGNKDDFSKHIGVGFLFTEKYAGEDTYNVNMFVHRDYVRIDSMRTPHQYLLYKRGKQTLYRVDDNQKTIQVMRAQTKQPQEPIASSLEEIAGSSGLLEEGQSQHYRYQINGQTCYNIVAINDINDETVSVLSQIETILAQHKVSNPPLSDRSSDDACEAVIDSVIPTVKYNHGFVVREWGSNGYQRFLKEFKENVTPNFELNVLPKGYQRYSE